ncbi:glycosyltransferase N-terminal domain-containing protein, partial [Hydrogenimonas sp.]
AGRGLCREVRYLPFEPLLWLWVRHQKALVVMEAELWFLLFYLAKARGAKTFLINARISERSYPRYMRFRWLYRRIFAQVDTVFAQSEADKARLEALGARRVEVTGNIKLAQKPEVSRRYEKPPNLVVTAASTHEGEEPGILEAFALFGKRHEGAKLLLVPRHPERFERVAKLAEGFCQNAGLSFGRWRDGARFDADVVLVDRMGELVNLYAVSDIVVLGGAFVPVGGHNPAEVLPFGCRLVTGPHIFNQRAIFAAVEGARFGEMEELAEALEAALEAEPPKLRTPVTLEPIIEELRRVV